MFDPPWYRESEVERLAFTMYVLEKEGLFDVEDETIYCRRNRKYF